MAIGSMLAASHHQGQPALQLWCDPLFADGYAHHTQVFLLVSASQAFLLNLCIFWCTTTNSPLATTVTGTHACKLCCLIQARSQAQTDCCMPG